MKKCSTAVLFWAFASISAAVQANPGDCQILPHAPERHVVTPDDTLWDISAVFLNHPWCWPRAWGISQDKLNEPQQIYPGQVVVLDRAAGTLQLASAAAKTGSAIPVVNMRLVRQFLAQAVILEQDDLASMPYVTGGQDGRTIMGGGDKLYVAGDMGNGRAFTAMRAATPVKDPLSGELLGYESVLLGQLQMVQKGASPEQASVMQVTRASREIRAGDKVVPAAGRELLQIIPRPPQGDVRARIISSYDGTGMVGENQVVLLDKGERDTLQVGTVLALYQSGRQHQGNDGTMVALPDESFGQVLVFRVFGRLSYGLVMQVTEPVKAGDVARSPDSAAITGK